MWMKLMERSSKFIPNTICIPYQNERFRVGLMKMFRVMLTAEVNNIGCIGGG